MTLEDLQIADGQITEICYTKELLIVTFYDWQEKKYELNFLDVIAIEALSPEGEDIAELTIEENNAFTIRAREVTKEDGDFRCYLFTSAWTGLTILQIVATDCSVECGV